jgi:hypothetical protein
MVVRVRLPLRVQKVKGTQGEKMGMSSIRKLLAKMLEKEASNAFDLWTCLPSYKAAKACHGDYASEFVPSVADVLAEAAMCISFLNGYDHEEEKKRGEFECPCGECTRPKTCKGCDYYADNLMKCRAVEDAPHCDADKPHSRCPFIRGNGGLLFGHTKKEK